jgi:hypothetical protein
MHVREEECEEPSRFSRALDLEVVNFEVCEGLDDTEVGIREGAATHFCF